MENEKESNMATPIILPLSIVNTYEGIEMLVPRQVS